MSEQLDELGPLAVGLFDLLARLGHPPSRYLNGGVDREYVRSEVKAVAPSIPTIPEQAFIWFSVQNGVDRDSMVKGEPVVFDVFSPCRARLNTLSRVLQFYNDDVRPGDLADAATFPLFVNDSGGIYALRNLDNIWTMWLRHPDDSDWVALSNGIPNLPPPTLSDWITAFKSAIDEGRIVVDLEHGEPDRVGIGEEDHRGWQYPWRP